MSGRLFSSRRPAEKPRTPKTAPPASEERQIGRPGWRSAPPVHRSCPRSLSSTPYDLVARSSNRRVRRERQARALPVPEMASVFHKKRGRFCFSRFGRSDVSGGARANERAPDGISHLCVFFFAKTCGGVDIIWEKKIYETDHFSVSFSAFACIHSTLPFRS